MSNCIWPSLKKHTPCVNCGYPLPRDYAKPPILVCEPRGEFRKKPNSAEPQFPYTTKCSHLGEVVNQIKVKCGPQSSTMHIVYECNIHKRCIPTYHGPWDADHETEASLYHLCGFQNCSDYQPVKVRA